MQAVSERLKTEALNAMERSVGEKKGGCALYSRDGKLYSGFCVCFDGLVITPLDMALSLALGDKTEKFTVLYLCGDGLDTASLKRLCRFGDIMVNGEKDGKRFATTLKKLILAAGEK